MIVLVIGGAGYIGSHTGRELKRLGHTPLIYDNLSTGHEFLATGFEFVKGDILDPSKLLPLLDRVDAIMHFAAHAYVGESVTNPAKILPEQCGRRAFHVERRSQCRGEKDNFFLDLCSLRGTIPGSISENTPRQPVNPYGVSKLFFEHALEAYDRAYGLQFASLRYFNAAGADESGEIGELHEPESHLIPLALRAAAGAGPELQVFGSDYPTPDGTCIRDYVHVTDLAEAHVKALEHLQAGKESFAANLGTGRGRSVREVITAVEEVTGKPVPVRLSPRRPGDPPALVADPSRAETLLHWKARRSLRESVSTAWNWMRRHRGSTDIL